MVRGVRWLEEGSAHQTLPYALGRDKSWSEEEQVLRAGMLCGVLPPRRLAFASLGSQEEVAVLVAKPLQLPSRAVGERGSHRAAGLGESFWLPAVSRHKQPQRVGFLLCSWFESSQSFFAPLFYGAFSNMISQCKAVLLSWPRASLSFMGSRGKRQNFQKPRNWSSSHVTNPPSDVHDNLCACKLTSSAQYCFMGLWCRWPSRSTFAIALAW